MTTNKMITVELLKANGACKDQIKLFQQLFPNGIIPTRELCIEYAADFDWDWAAERLLSENDYKIYDESIEPALKIYYESIAPARKIYKESFNIALKNKVSVADAGTIYDESTESAWTLFEESKAIAWFDCWKRN